MWQNQGTFANEQFHVGWCIRNTRRLCGSDNHLCSTMTGNGLDARRLVGLARSIAIYYGRPWRNRALRTFYSQLVGPGDLAFDIGAHVGNRTRILYKLGATVIAVEPQTMCHRFLAATLPRDRITLRQVAIGASEGVATLHVSRRHPTVSTLSGGWANQVASDPSFSAVSWDASEEVACTTLDRLISEFGTPRFCKIDVEGNEAEALAGLHSSVPVIAFEYIPAALDLVSTCLDRLDRLGTYRFNVVVGEATAFSWQEPVYSDEVRKRLPAIAASGGHGDLYALLDGAGMWKGPNG